MSHNPDRDRKLVFALSKGENGKAIVIIGIPRLAWMWMKDSKTHHFDLSSAGLPLQLMLFGAKTHEEARQLIDQGMAMRGEAYFDERRTDFSIPHPEGGSTDIDMLRNALRDCCEWMQDNHSSYELKKPVTKELLARIQKLLGHK